MTANEIHTRLQQLAPSVSFASSRKQDTFFRWDGDGPDPEDEGFLAYDVDVTATTIIEGKLVSSTASLGGCYMTHDEPIDDIHGYLPQMLEEAASDLAKLLPEGHALHENLTAVTDFLSQEMRGRWEQQQKGN